MSRMKVRIVSVLDQGTNLNVAYSLNCSSTMDMELIQYANWPPEATVKLQSMASPTVRDLEATVKLQSMGSPTVRDPEATVKLQSMGSQKCTWHEQLIAVSIQLVQSIHHQRYIQGEPVALYAEFII